MGEIADDMLRVVLCEGCGEYLGSEVGHPRRCNFIHWICGGMELQMTANNPAQSNQRREEIVVQRDPAETPRDAFIKIVRANGKVWASTSHEQHKPDHISSSGILEWQYDGELFAITKTRRRVVANKSMPAFHIYSVGVAGREG